MAHTAWLMAGKVSRLVLAIISKETREVVERWQFDVALENQKASASGQADDEAKENEPVGCVIDSGGFCIRLRLVRPTVRTHQPNPRKQKRRSIRRSKLSSAKLQQA